MDDFNGSSIYDMSGRMRHGTYFGFDATSPGQGNITAQHQAVYIAIKAFDDGGNTSDSRWLAQGNQLPNGGFYDFTQSVEISHYTIQSKVTGMTPEHPKTGRFRIK